jgi:hypothetical protein
MAPKLIEERIGNIDRCAAHLVGVTQRRLFRGCEEVADLVALYRRQFLKAVAYRTATGSVDVDSERATDQLRRAEAYQPFQSGGNKLQALERHVGDCETYDHAGAMRHHPERGQHLAKLPRHHGPQPSDAQGSFMLFQRTYSHRPQPPVKRPDALLLLAGSWIELLLSILSRREPHESVAVENSLISRKEDTEADVRSRFGIQPGGSRPRFLASSNRLRPE